MIVIFAVLIAVVLSLSAFAFSFANLNNKKASETLNAVQGFELDSDGYNLIKTATDLRNIEKDITAKYRLANDIDLSKSGSWRPIGQFYGTGKHIYGDSFKGELDGNGHMISGLTINVSNSAKWKDYMDYFLAPDYVGFNLVWDKTGSWGSSIDGYALCGGLFGIIGSGATVKNLMIKDSNISFNNIEPFGKIAIGMTEDYMVAVGFVSAFAYQDCKLESIYVKDSNISVDTNKSNGAQPRIDVGGLVGFWVGGARVGSADKTFKISYSAVSNVNFSITATAGKSSDRSNFNQPWHVNLGGLVGCIGLDGNNAYNNILKIETSYASTRMMVDVNNDPADDYNYRIIAIGGLVGKTYVKKTGIYGSFAIIKKMSYVKYSAKNANTNKHENVGQILGDLFAINDDNYTYMIIMEQARYPKFYQSERPVDFKGISLSDDLHGAGGITLAQAQMWTFDSFNIPEAVDGGVFPAGQNFMILNADPNGLPIPRPFAYGIELENLVSDNSEIRSANNFDSNHYELYESIKDEGRVVSKSLRYRGYYLCFPYGSEFGCVKGADDRTYNLTVNGVNYLSYTLKNYSRKWLGNKDLLFRFPSNNDGKIVWSGDSTKINVISISSGAFRNYELTIRRNQYGILTGDSNDAINLKYGAVTSGLVKNIEIVNNSLKQVYEMYYTLQDGQVLNSDNESIIKLVKDKNNKNKYSLLITSNNIVYNQLNIELDNKGYSLWGLAVRNQGAGKLKGVPVDQERSMNEHFYTNSEMGDSFDYINQEYFLVFEYDTVEVNVGTDKGGDVQGRVQEYNKSSDNYTSKDMKVEGVDHTVTGQEYRYASYQVKFFDEKTITIYMTTNVDTSNANYIVANAKKGYKFTGWTISYISGSRQWYYGNSGWGTAQTTLNAKQYIDSGRGTSLILNLTYPNENNIENLEKVGAGSVSITAEFDPIEYKLNLWDEKVTEGHSAETINGLKAEYVVNYTIETNDESFFEYYKPINEDGGELEYSWAILLNRYGQVLGNANLECSTSLENLINGNGGIVSFELGDNVWKFYYTEAYLNIDGNYVVVLKGIALGSSGELDNLVRTEGNIKIYSTYTLEAVSVNKYSLTVKNEDEGIWSGESEELMGVKGYGTRVETNSRLNLTLKVSQINAFKYFSTNGLAFNLKRNYSHFNSAQYTDSSKTEYYAVYKYGYEITGYTIKLMLGQNIDTIYGQTNTVYLIITNGIWGLKAQMSGRWYIKTDVEDWKSTDSNTLINITNLKDLDMRDMCGFLDRQLIGNKSERLNGASFTMTPSWKAAIITAKSENKILADNIEYATDYQLNVNQQNLASKGNSIAYFIKNGMYVVNEGKWNYYGKTSNGITTTNTVYTYENGKYVITLAKYEVPNVYKVKLESGVSGRIVWELEPDDSEGVEESERYKNYYTMWDGSTTNRTATKYTYSSSEIFNYQTYSAYGQEWIEDYVEYFCKNNNSYIAQYISYINTPEQYTENKETIAVRLDKLFDSNIKANLMLTVFGSGESRYIYLTNKTSLDAGASILPVFKRAENSKYYKLNYWFDDTYAYATGKYSNITDGETTPTEVKSYWGVDTSGEEGSYRLVANYFREYYYLKVNTLLNDNLGRYGYILVNINDKACGEKDASYLVLCGEDVVIYYYSTETNNFKLKDKLDNLEAKEDPIKVYAGCEIQIIAKDQSKDKESMASGKFDELIGYRFKNFEELVSDNKTSIGSLAYASTSDYEAIVGGEEFAQFAKNNGLITGHVFKVDVNFEHIQYSFNIGITEENGYNSGTFSYTNGTKTVSGKTEQADIATVNEEIGYIINYYAYAGYEFQNRAFTLNKADRQVDLSLVDKYLVVSEDGTRVEAKSSVEGMDAERIIYAPLLLEDGTYTQTYKFKIYGTWLRLFYYQNLDSAYTVQDTDIGKININTKEIALNYGIKYYDKDENQYLEDKKVEGVSLKIASPNKSTVVLYTTNEGEVQNVPYGMVVKKLYNQNAYVYEYNNTEYTMVQSYMYFKSNPTVENYDRQYYGLPYYATDLNIKTYNIISNFTLRVNYAAGTILPNIEEERTIYYVFAMRKLLSVEVEVEYSVLDTNDTEREISITNTMNKSNSQTNALGSYTNTNTLTLKGNASNNGTNYVVGENVTDKYLTGIDTTLMKFYSYKGLRNTINFSYDASVRYSGVSYSFNEEILQENDFTIEESGKLKVKFIPKALPVNVIYHLTDWDGQKIINEEVDVERLKDLKIITNQPEIKIEHLMSIENLSEVFVAYLGSKLGINIDKLGLSEDYEFSYEISMKTITENGYLTTTEDYNNKAIRIDFYFKVKDGNVVTIKFDIEGYKEGESVGEYGVQIEPYTEEVDLKEINNKANAVRVIGNRTTKLLIELGKGFYYDGYSYNGLNKVNNELENNTMLLTEFETSDAQTHTYTIYIKKYEIKVNLAMGTKLDGTELPESEDYTISNVISEYGSKELTTKVNETIYIHKKANESESLISYYYKVGEEEKEISRIVNTGRLEITGEVLEALTKTNTEYKLTIYVRYTKNYTLKVNVGEGGKYLGEEITEGEETVIRNYLTYIGEEQTEISEENNQPKYFEEGTTIKLKVLLKQKDKYVVWLTSKEGNYIIDSNLEAEIELDKDVEVTIHCAPENYEAGTTSILISTLEELATNSGKEVEKTTNEKGYGAEISEQYTIKKYGGVLKRIQITGNDAPSILIEVGEQLEVKALSGNYENVEVEIRGDSIVISWEEEGSRKMKTYTYAIEEGEIKIRYTIENEIGIRLYYVDYKTITEISKTR